MKKISKILLGVILLLGVGLLTSTGVKAEGSSLAISNLTFTSNYGWEASGALNFTGAPIEQLTVALYCNGVKTAENISGLDGNFVMKSNCVSGQDSYAEVVYNDVAVQSAHVAVPSISGGRHRLIVGPAQLQSIQNPTGVPEFSLLGMGAAVIIVTLGLVFLRKN
jgi:hypothetical protein